MTSFRKNNPIYKLSISYTQISMSIEKSTVFCLLHYFPLSASWNSTLPYFATFLPIISYNSQQLEFHLDPPGSCKQELSECTLCLFLQSVEYKTPCIFCTGEVFSYFQRILLYFMKLFILNYWLLWYLLFTSVKWWFVMVVHKILKIFRIED